MERNRSYYISCIIQHIHIDIKYVIIQFIIMCYISLRMCNGI
jgi:hypothetical protein